MILENGVIRTMDPTMPVALALAIAGDRIAGGVGTHEQALASPDVLRQIATLGGTPTPGTATEFATLISDEQKKWKRVIEATGAKVE